MSDIPTDQERNKPRISAAIITRDDAHRIESTIKSVLPLVDRVYIMDFGSTDETITIAKKLGVTVFQTAWKLDYSEIRNSLLDRIEEQGQTDLVLWIDPGELFDSRTSQDFQVFLDDSFKSDTAYMLIVRKYWLEGEKNLPDLLASFVQDENTKSSNVLNPVDGFSDWNEEQVEIRLAPLSEKLRFTGRVRESMIPTIEQNGYPVSGMSGRILGTIRPFKHSEPVAAAERNMEILKDVEEAGLAFSDDEMFVHAESLVNLSDTIGAREIYKKLIENATLSNVRLESYYRYNATFGIVPPVENEQVDLLLQSLDVYPVDLQLLVNLGCAMIQKHQFEMAIRVFHVALQHGRVSLDVWHKQCVQEIAVAHLSLLYRITSQPQEAMELLEQLICVDQPTHTQLAKLLIDLYTVNRAEDKLNAFAANYWGDTALDHIREVFTGACRATSGAWAAALVSLENAYEKGCRDWYCLRWYSLALLSNLRFERACKILDEWLAIDPNNFEAKSFRFAAAHPDKFHEILANLHQTQAERLGIELADNFDNLPKPGVDAEIDAASETREIHPSQQVSPKVFDARSSFSDFDIFNFESESQNSVDLTFRTPQK